MNRKDKEKIGMRKFRDITEKEQETVFFISVLPDDSMVVFSSDEDVIGRKLQKRPEFEDARWFITDYALDLDDIVSWQNRRYQHRHVEEIQI
jgi:hypothetical protein